MSEMLEEILGLEEDTQKGKYLIFSLGNEQYGIEIKYVTEIIGIQPITEVPEFPEYIKGIVNLRGRIIPVMDVRLRFKKDLREYDDRTCIIIVNVKENSVGLVIDRVLEVVSILDEHIAPPPQLNKASSKYINGIGKVGSEVKLLLECEKLLDDGEFESLKEVI